MENYVAMSYGNKMSTYPGFTQDWHGGHSEEHRAEMRAIAQEVIAE